MYIIKSVIIEYLIELNAAAEILKLHYYISIKTIKLIVSITNY